MKPERRYSRFELRAGSGDGIGQLSGVALPYGVTAEIVPGLRERFEPGSLKFDRVLVNVQHDRGRAIASSDPRGGLTLTDGPQSLEIAVDLPDTQDGRDVKTLAERGVLRGFSIEFLATDDAFVDGVRIVRAADLRAVAVVDAPAYDGARIDEVRQGLLARAAAQDTEWLL